MQLGRDGAGNTRMSGQFAKAGLLAIALLAGDAQAVAPEDAPAQAPAPDRRAQAGAAVPAPQASAPPPPPRVASRYITPPATGQVPQAAIVRLAPDPAPNRLARTGAAVPASPVWMLPPPPPRTASRFLAPPATREAPQAAVVRPAQAPAPDSRAQGDANAAVPAPQVPESRPTAPSPSAPKRPQTSPEKPQKAASPPPPPRIASRYITPPATGQAPQATVVRLAQAPEPAAAAQTAAGPTLAEQNTAAREAYRSASRAVGALVDRMRQAQAEVDRLRRGRDRQALRDARARARAVRAELLQARAARDAAKRERDRVILLAAAAEQSKAADEIKALFASASGRAELASRLRQYPKVKEWHTGTVRNVTDAGMLVGIMEHAVFGVRYAPSGIAEDPHYAGLRSGVRPLSGRWAGAVAGYYTSASAGSAKHIGAGTALLKVGVDRRGRPEVAGLFHFGDDFPVREMLLVKAPLNRAAGFSGADADFILAPPNEPLFFTTTPDGPRFSHNVFDRFNDMYSATTPGGVRVNGRMDGAVFGPEHEEVAGSLLAKKFVNGIWNGNLRAAFGTSEIWPFTPKPTGDWGMAPLH